MRLGESGVTFNLAGKQGSWLHAAGNLSTNTHHYGIIQETNLVVQNGSAKTLSGFANTLRWNHAAPFGSVNSITNDIFIETCGSAQSGDVNGVKTTIQVTDADVDCQNIYGLKTFLNLDDGNTSTNVYGEYTEIDIEANHEAQGNVYGSYIKVVDDDSSAGIVEGLTLEGAGINNNNHHSFYRRMTITKAHSGDNTVIAEVCKIPALSIIKRIKATLITKSNLGTYVLNLNLSTSSGTSADGALANASTTITVPEVLGAGGVATYAQNSATVLGTAADIVASSGATNKTIYTTQPTTTVVGTADTFLYICNAGTGNGTSDSNATVIDVVVDYIGVD